MSRLWTLWPCASMFKLCCRNNNMGRSFEKKFWLFGQFSEHNCYSSLMTISYSWTRIYIFLLSKHWPLKVAKQCSKRKLVSILNFESVAKKSVKVFSIPSLLFLLIISYNVLKKKSFFCPTKSDLSGNTIWPQAPSIQKLAKIEHCGPNGSLIFSANKDKTFSGSPGKKCCR